MNHFGQTCSPTPSDGLIWHSTQAFRGKRFREVWRAISHGRAPRPVGGRSGTDRGRALLGQCLRPSADAPRLRAWRCGQEACHRPQTGTMSRGGGGGSIGRRCKRPPAEPPTQTDTWRRRTATQARSGPPRRPASTSRHHGRRTAAPPGADTAAGVAARLLLGMLLRRYDTKCCQPWKGGPCLHSA